MGLNENVAFLWALLNVRLLTLSCKVVTWHSLVYSSFSNPISHYDIYILGGVDSNDMIKTDVYKYEDNADGNEWKRVQGMKISRTDHSLDVVENFEALACDIRTTTTTTTTTTATTTTTTTEHSQHHYFSFTIFLVLLGIICCLSVVIIILFICCCCWMGKAKSIPTQSKQLSRPWIEIILTYLNWIPLNKRVFHY